jgi:hypothetical protein
MSHPLTTLAVHLTSLVATRTADDRPRGQATAEYALVLLGAAVVAIALITWATGSGRFGDLFDRVFDVLQSRL